MTSERHCARTLLTGQELTEASVLRLAERPVAPDGESSGADDEPPPAPRDVQRCAQVLMAYVDRWPEGEDAQRHLVETLRYLADEKEAALETDLAHVGDDVEHPEKKPSGE